MITSDDLAKLKIRHTIFHDVPNSPKGATGQPTLAETETDVDAQRSGMLKRRLTQVLASKAAYPIEFLATPSSPVPAEVQQFTAKPDLKQFIEMSRRLAQYLFQQQTGAISPGLLCVMDVVTGGKAGIAILKLEREEGAELEIGTTPDGKRVFTMDVLENLVLTEGTRLFKSALFVRAGEGEFRGAACDSQRTVVTSEDVARFWLRFLGCRVMEEPRVSTQRWFEATVRFVNEHVTDPVVKNDIYEHLVSELNSNKQTVAPKKFIEDYVPKSYRQTYEGFLKENKVALHQFEKDISDISTKLRRRAFHTTNGISVTVPIEQTELVDVEAEQIVIHDQLLSIVHK